MNHEDLEIMLDKELEEMLLLEALEDNVDNELNLNEDNDEKVLPKKRKKRKKFSKRIKETLKIKSVLILLLTLIVNTYAWFIYISSSSLGLNIHVRSWQFDFSVEDENKNDSVVLIEGEIYPGMDPLEKEIVAENKGETKANLSYKISYIRVFDDVLLPPDTTITPEELRTLLEEKKYPFNIKLNMSRYEEIPENITPTDSLILEGGQKAKINVLLTWEYESGETEEDKKQNNEKDTELGKAAYKYYHSKPENSVESESTAEKEEAIEIRVRIEAVQIEDTEE